MKVKAWYIITCERVVERERRLRATERDEAATAREREGGVIYNDYKQKTSIY